MSVDIVECGAEEKTKPRVPRGNDSRGLPGLPSDLTVLQTAPAHTFSSLEVSQQDVDQAAGAGRVKVRQGNVWFQCCTGVWQVRRNKDRFANFPTAILPHGTQESPQKKKVPTTHRLPSA